MIAEEKRVQQDIELQTDLNALLLAEKNRLDIIINLLGIHNLPV